MKHQCITNIYAKGAAYTIVTAAFFSLAACGRHEKDADGVEADLASSSEVRPAAKPAESVSLDSLPAPYNQADYANGKALFNQCIACHSLTEGKNGLGPHLSNILDRKAGSVLDYQYSDALKKSGRTWDAVSLDQWIENSMKLIPQTKMNYAGMRDADDRRDVIAYLIVSSSEQ